MDNRGIRSSGRIISQDPQTGQAAILENGKLILQNDASEITAIISYANNGLTLQSYGGEGSHVVLNRNGDISIWSEGNLSLVCKGNLRINSRGTKSGRAEFSDGTYLDFEKGYLVGGNTKEGAF